MKGIKHIFQLLMAFMVISETGFAQRLDWHLIDENESHFGFVGYQGARSNVATDPTGNIVYCAPFANQIIADNQTDSKQFETAIIKRDPDGDLIWLRTLNGNGFKYGHSLTTDNQGNIYLLGWYYGNSTVNGSPLYSYGNYDCFLIKLNSSGQVVYTRTFGSAGYDYPFGVKVDDNGRAYIAGKFAFSLQCDGSSLSGAANSHFLIRLQPNGSLDYMRNICQNGTGDWGRGGIDLNSNGKVFVVSSFQGNSVFQQQYLSGTGSNGYTAILDESTGDIDTVIKAGTEAWLVSHDPAGFPVLVGLHAQNADSVGGQAFPALNGGSEWYIAKLRDDGQLVNLRRFKRSSGGFNAQEALRTLHINVAGQVFLSGEFEDSFESDLGRKVFMELPHASGKPQGILLKTDESFRLKWYAGVGSQDTLGIANANFGCGLASDYSGNLFWNTMNFANSVVKTDLVLNTDTFSSGTLTSRFAANGIHLWKLSEPFILTKNPHEDFYCPGDTLSIPFEKFGRFDAGNIFELQLSDSSGSFLNPLVLGSVTDTVSGRIAATLPLSLEPSTKYRFRVNSSKPVLEGAFNPMAIGVRGKPNANAGPDQYFCLGDTFALEAGGGGTYAWDNDPFLLNPDSAKVFVFPPGDREFRVRVQDSISACYNLDTVRTIMRVQVRADSIPDTTICFGQELLVQGQLLEGDTSRITYAWYRNQDTLVSDSQSVQIIGQQSAQYMLVMWDSCSILRDTQFFEVQVRAPLSVQLPKDTAVCYQATLNLIPTISGGLSSTYSFRWTDSLTGDSLSGSAGFEEGLSQSSTLILALSDGCSADPDSARIHVHVWDFPTIDMPDTTLACQGDSIGFKAETSGIGVLEYKWPGTSFQPQDSLWRMAFSISSLERVIVRDVCGFMDSADFFIQVRQKKNMSVRSDTTICEGESVLIYVTGSEDDTAHYDLFWNGSMQSRNYYIENFDSTSRLRVQIRNNCDQDIQEDSVLITVRPKLDVDIMADTHFCYGESLTLSAINQGGLASGYVNTWKNGQGDVLFQGNDFTVVIRDSIRLNLILEDGCSAHADSIAYSAKSSPEIQLASQADTVLCHGQLWQFTAVATGGNGSLQYLFNPYDSLQLAQGVNVYQGFVQRVIADDGCSEQDTLSFVVQVNNPLRLKLVGDTAICQGETLSLDPEIGGGVGQQYSFSWNGVSKNSKAFDWPATQDSVFRFCLSDGCSKDTCAETRVTVHKPLDNDFTLADTVLCIPQNLQLQSALYSVQSEWQWRLRQFGWDTTVNSPNLTLPWDEAGSFSISLRVLDSNGCISTWREKEFKGVNPPNAFFGTNDTVVEIDRVLHIEVPNQSISSYSWTPAVSRVSATDFEWVASDTGSYTFNLIAANKWGCLDTFQKDIRVKYPFNCWVATGFNTNQNIEEEPFFPICSEWALLDWEVYNRWGQLVFQSGHAHDAWNGRMMNTGEPVSAGVYLVVLQAVNQYGERVNYSGTLTLIR